MTDRASKTVSGSQTFGVVRIGLALLALPAEVIREVVPKPARLLSLASSSHLLRGAIELRREAIPVVCVAELCGQLVDNNNAPLVVIIRHEGALIGILADAVADIATVKRSALNPIYQAAGGDLVVSTFMLGDQLINELNPAAILSMHGVPHVRETAPTRSIERSQRLMSNVVFRVGGMSLCLPAHEVDGTEPESRVIDSPMMAGDCEGIIHYHGMEVPIVDTVPILGLGWPPKRPRRAAAIVLRFPNKGLLAFRIDEVVDIARQDEGLICPVPPGIVSNHALYRGIYVNARGDRVLVLDPQACRRDPQMAQYASLVKPIEQSSSLGERLPVISTVREMGTKSIAAQAPYLLANCGMDFCTPVASVSEVIALPPEAREAWSNGSAFLCAITHRQRAVPIYALERLLATPAGGDLARASVLLIRMEAMTIGFAVNELHSIQRAAEELKAPATADVPMRLEEFDMIRLRRSGPPTWVPVVDLPALTRNLTDSLVQQSSDWEEDLDVDWLQNLPQASELAEVS